MDKLIITVALTGNVPTTEMNPNLPVTPDEIAADLRRCADAAAIALGGHVRVGLEDNLYLPDGSPASNPKLVDKVVAIAKEIGREIAGPDEARSLLSLNPQFKDRIIT